MLVHTHHISEICRYVKSVLVPYVTHDRLPLSSCVPPKTSQPNTYYVARLVARKESYKIHTHLKGTHLGAVTRSKVKTTSGAGWPGAALPKRTTVSPLRTFFTRATPRWGRIGREEVSDMAILVSEWARYVDR